MTIVLAAAHAVPKPWGRADLAPWRSGAVPGKAVGEVRFALPDANAPKPALLLKLLFTDQPLSIQVHPDDAFARTIGLENGKSEAWYILDAQPNARVGVGLTRRLGAARLRAAIADRSIASLLHWRQVRAGDVVFVPAGMIHAIGAGLVVAEIQQRSDATFRLFDHDRARGLHVEHAVAAADTSLRDEPVASVGLHDGTAIILATPHFVIERLVLPPGAQAEIDAPGETWLLVIDGAAQVGPVRAVRGDAVHAVADRAALTAGTSGVTVLIAYPGPTPRTERRAEAVESDGRRLVRSHPVLEVGA